MLPAEYGTRNDIYCNSHFVNKDAKARRQAKPEDSQESMAESHPPPLCSLGLQPHPQVRLCLGGDEGKGDKSVVQHLHWSKSRGPAPRVPPPPPAEMGAASVAASHSSLATPHRAVLCRVSQASCQVPGARASAGCCPVLAGMTPSSCPSQRLRSSWAPGGWGTSEGEEPPGSGAGGLQCVQKVDYRALVTP